MTIEHVFDAFDVNQIDAMSDDAHATRIPGGATFVAGSRSPGVKSLCDTLDGLPPASRVDQERSTVCVDVECLSPCLNVDSSRQAGRDPRARFIKSHQTHSTDQPTMKDETFQRITAVGEPGSRVDSYADRDRCARFKGGQRPPSQTDVGESNSTRIGQVHESLSGLQRRVLE